DQDRLTARTPNTAEERAGNLAGGVLALLQVHGEREEVEVVLRVLASRGRAQDDGVVVPVGHGRPGGLLGDPASLEPDGAGAEGAVVDDGFGELQLGTLHGCAALVISSRSGGHRSRPTGRVWSGGHYRRPSASAAVGW